MLGNIIAAGASILGGILGNKSAEKNAERNIQLQKDFAQQGIQWKVADARKAGIHPLYALGAQTHSFSPVSVGDPLSSSISRAGQDIGRAVNSTQSPTGKYQAALASLQLQRGELENALLASQLAKMNQPASQTSIPSASQRYLIDGQGQTALLDGGVSSVPGTVLSAPSLLKEKPMERLTVEPTAPFRESAAVGDMGIARTVDGHAIIPSKDVKERIEDMEIYEAQHWMRNQLVPFLTMSHKGVTPPPEGMMWQVNPFTGSLVLAPDPDYYKMWGGKGWLRGRR